MALSLFGDVRGGEGGFLLRPCGACGVLVGGFTQGFARRLALGYCPAPLWGFSAGFARVRAGLHPRLFPLLCGDEVGGGVCLICGFSRLSARAGGFASAAPLLVHRRLSGSKGKAADLKTEVRATGTLAVL